MEGWGKGGEGGYYRERGLRGRKGDGGDVGTEKKLKPAVDEREESSARCSAPRSVSQALGLGSQCAMCHLLLHFALLPAVALARSPAYPPAFPLSHAPSVPPCPSHLSLSPSPVPLCSFPCVLVHACLPCATNAATIRACVHTRTRCAVGTQCSGTRIRATVSLETRSTRRRAWSSTARPAKRTCRSGLATPS